MLVKWPSEITIYVMCIDSGRAYDRSTTESVKNKTIICLGWIVRLNFDKKKTYGKCKYKIVVVKSKLLQKCFLSKTLRFQNAKM